jgi:hypothetical protein
MTGRRQPDVEVAQRVRASAKLRLSQMPEFQVVVMPPEIATGVEYGLAILNAADPRANDL